MTACALSSSNVMNGSEFMRTTAVGRRDLQPADGLRTVGFVRSFDTYFYVGLFEEETRLEEERSADLWIGPAYERAGPYALREHVVNGTWCVCEGREVVEERGPDEYLRARATLYALSGASEPAIPPALLAAPPRPLWGPRRRGTYVCPHGM